MIYAAIMRRWTGRGRCHLRLDLVVTDEGAPTAAIFPFITISEVDVSETWNRNMDIRQVFNASHVAHWPSAHGVLVKKEWVDGIVMTGGRTTLVATPVLK
jgi:hypothetical protein